MENVEDRIQLNNIWRDYFNQIHSHLKENSKLDQLQKIIILAADGARISAQKVDIGDIPNPGQPEFPDESSPDPLPDGDEDTDDDDIPNPADAEPGKGDGSGSEPGDGSNPGNGSVSQPGGGIGGGWGNGGGWITMPWPIFAGPPIPVPVDPTPPFKPTVPRPPSQPNPPRQPTPPNDSNPNPPESPDNPGKGEQPLSACEKARLELAKFQRMLAFHNTQLLGFQIWLGSSDIGDEDRIKASELIKEQEKMIAALTPAVAEAEKLVKELCSPLIV